jgi:hypothetical protein
MVSRLAQQIVARYAPSGSAILDPFCGSGTVPVAAARQGLVAIGRDINPYAVLLTRVKLEGFDPQRASRLLDSLATAASSPGPILPILLERKKYWFTSGTLAKLERIRYVARTQDLPSTRAGRAILLSLALAVRKCSRADQRSPKPFISKIALVTRKGKHFDPIRETRAIFARLMALHSGAAIGRSDVAAADVASGRLNMTSEGVSHVVTSPPYINAQDYYRNFKLELAMLQDLLPFSREVLRDRFIGTERGDLMAPVQTGDFERNVDLFPQLHRIEATHPRSAAVIHRYLCDMWKCLEAVKRVLQRRGTLVIVCGDNLIAGYSVPTWKLLNEMVRRHGFVMFDMFGDRIDRRLLPPKRHGHKGLIKQEVVSAFTLESR